MYIRFVVGTEAESARFQSGLFTEVERLREEGKLQPYQIELVQEIFKFFNDGLPVPPYSTKSWSINAISWFKDSASDYIDKMWDLKSILEENDFNVRIIKTDKPGMVLYEDDFQVVSQNRKH